MFGRLFSSTIGGLMSPTDSSLGRRISSTATSLPSLSSAMSRKI